MIRFKVEYRTISPTFGDYRDEIIYLHFEESRPQMGSCLSWLYGALRVRGQQGPLNSLRPNDAYIYISKLTNIGSDNGLSPDQCQAIIWTNAGRLFIRPLGTDFSEIFIQIYAFSFKKMDLKMLSGKWRPSCLGPNVLTNRDWLQSHQGKVITSIIKCGMKLLIHSQTSTVAPSKFGNG